MKSTRNTELIAHLKELKKRLIIVVLAFLAATILSYLFVEEIYKFLVQPLADAVSNGPNRMIYTGLAEAFVTYLKLSIFAGLIISFPVLAYQIYAFCAPGMYAHERRFFVPFLILSPGLFLAGAAFVYYLLFPLAWEFFLSYEMPGGNGTLPIVLEAKISEYLSLVTLMILAFGITFQLPLVLILMFKFGVISVKQLEDFRKYAVVVILTVAAFLTPPDVISQLALATPLYLFYEFSIFFCKLLSKKKTITANA